MNKSAALYQSNKLIPDDMLLGHMFFQKLPCDIKIEETDLLNLMHKAGVDQRHVKKISRIDAFRRATSMVKQSVNINYNGSTYEALIEVTEVKNDKDETVRLLGRKVIDNAKQEVQYDTVGRFDMDKHSLTLSGQVDPNYATEYNYQEVIDGALDRFLLFSNYHTKDTVRNMMVRIVDDLAPISLLDTGVAKFIPIKYKPELYALQEFIYLLNNASYSSGDGAFEVIPLIDTDDQRELIERQASVSIVDDVKTLMVTIAEAIQQRGELTTATVANYSEKLKKIESVIEDYEDTIGTLLPIAKQQLSKAVELVQANKAVVKAPTPVGLEDGDMESLDIVDVSDVVLDV